MSSIELECSMCGKQFNSHFCLANGLPNYLADNLARKVANLAGKMAAQNEGKPAARPRGRCKNISKGARASREPLLLVFWMLPSGLAAGLLSIWAAILPARLVIIHTRNLPGGFAGPLAGPLAGKMAIQLSYAHTELSTWTWPTGRGPWSCWQKSNCSLVQTGAGHVNRCQLTTANMPAAQSMKQTFKEAR